MMDFINILINPQFYVGVLRMATPLLLVGMAGSWPNGPVLSPSVPKVSCLQELFSDSWEVSLQEMYGRVFLSP